MRKRIGLEPQACLPVPASVRLSVVSERARDETGFLRRISRELRVEGTELSEGARRSFVYDEVERASLDAVVIVPYFLVRGEGDRDEPYVVFRTSVRPPVLLRSAERFAGKLRGQSEPLWEVPAGLVETTEETEEGLRAAAARELLEETGFRVGVGELLSLGAPGYPCPGVIGEKQYFFAALIDPAEQGEVLCDGSPLEEVFELAAIPLESALDELARFSGIDLKTEVALQRLRQRLR